MISWYLTVGVLLTTLMFPFLSTPYAIHRARPHLRHSHETWAGLLQAWLLMFTQNLAGMSQEKVVEPLFVASADAEMHSYATYFMMSNPNHMYHPQPKQAWDLVYSLILLAIQQWKNILNNLLF